MAAGSQSLSRSFLHSALFLVSSLTAHAADTCIEEICTHTWIVDPNSRVGQVTAIQNGQVTYSTGGRSYTLNPAQLSPEVESIGLLHSGGGLIDDQNRPGTASHVFKDGRVDYNTSDGYEYVSKSVSAETGEIANGEFSKSKRIIDSNNRIGTVKSVYENLSVLYVSDDGHIDVEKSDSLTPAVKQIGRLQAEVPLIDSDDRIGKALEVFKDGRVRYRTNDGYEYVSKTVSPSLDDLSSPELKRGSVALDSRNRTSTVVLVFEDQRVFYQTNDGYQDVSSSKNLSPEISNIGRLRKGVLLVDERNRTGTALLVVKDGRAIYQTPEGDQYVSNTVSPEVESLSDGELLANKALVDGSNRVGSILHLFEDTKLQYQTTDGHSYIQFTNQISPEVDSNADYDKNSAYATQAGNIGKVQKFFKDGRISIGTIDGDSIVTAKLYREVAEKQGYAAETLVNTSKLGAAQVEKVFENGIVQISSEIPSKIPSEKPRQIHSASRIHGLDEANKSEEKRLWIRDIASAIQKPEYALQTPSSLVIKQADYPALKSELSDLIRKQPDLLMEDQDLIKKVLEALK